MGNEDDASTLRSYEPHDRKEALNILPRQESRRLIQNQYSSPAQSSTPPHGFNRTHDRQKRSRSGSDILDFCKEINVQFEPRQQILRSANLFFPRNIPLSLETQFLCPQVLQHR